MFRSMLRRIVSFLRPTPTTTYRVTYRIPDTRTERGYRGSVDVTLPADTFAAMVVFECYKATPEGSEVLAIVKL